MTIRPFAGAFLGVARAALSAGAAFAEDVTVSFLTHWPPETVAKLQARIQQLGQESAKSLFMQATMGAYLHRELGTPALPNDPAFFGQQGD